MGEKVAVVYFSQTGNTEKVAARIAAGLGHAGAEVDLMKLEETDPAALRDYDFFGLGTPVFYYKLPYNVAWFIKRMRGMEGKFAFGFLTHGGHPANTFRRMQRRLVKRGITLVDTFECLGFDTYPPFIGKARQLGHPNEEELAAAERFGAGLLERRDKIKAGERELVPAFAAEYGRYARLAVLLTRPMLFMVSPRKHINVEKCTQCGICVENCPTHNIRLAPYPKFGWRCVYCYWCERACPEHAIECDWTTMTKRIEKHYSEEEEAQ